MSETKEKIKLNKPRNLAFGHARRNKINHNLQAIRSYILDYFYALAPTDTDIVKYEKSFTQITTTDLIKLYNEVANFEDLKDKAFTVKKLKKSYKVQLLDSKDKTVKI